MRAFFFSVAVMLSFFMPLQAQEIKFYHLNFRDGLSQSTVNCILQDNLGYYWFGTNDGLNKWNGYQIKVYYHQEDDPQSVGQGRINDLFKDRKGGIWIATYQGGLSRYIPEYDCFLFAG